MEKHTLPFCNKVKTILAFIFALSFLFAFAHKDRIERPTTYQFIFKNQDTKRLNRPSDSLLKAYSDEIVNGKRKLLSAELLFATGETLTFKIEGKKWTEIKIADGKNAISISNMTIEKVPEIHFATIALLWNGNHKRAFSANYFYVQFDIGTEKSYAKYPYLQLSFSDKKYTKTIIWRQISENSKQWKNF